VSASAAARTERLTVRYGRTTAVDAVSLDVPKGSVFALLGRNGAGKSSLLRCLLGWQKATDGRCELLGEDPWNRRANLMERVGVVPEEPDAPREMRGRSEKSAPARYRITASARNCMEVILFLLSPGLFPSCAPATTLEQVTHH
jgi:ABC-2 type transport system ATP-binding protein